MACQVLQPTVHHHPRMLSVADKGIRMRSSVCSHVLGFTGADTPYAKETDSHVLEVSLGADVAQVRKLL